MAPCVPSAFWHHLCLVPSHARPTLRSPSYILGYRQPGGRPRLEWRHSCPPLDLGHLPHGKSGHSNMHLLEGLAKEGRKKECLLKMCFVLFAVYCLTESSTPSGGRCCPATAGGLMGPSGWSWGPLELAGIFRLPPPSRR